MPNRSPSDSSNELAKAASSPGRAILVDSRQRVCAAIAEGLSCHQAAAGFKVSASSAIHWKARLRDARGVAPQPQSGDRKSGWIEAYAEFIPAKYEA
jgi:transposase